MQVTAVSSIAADARSSSCRSNIIIPKKKKKKQNSATKYIVFNKPPSPDAARLKTLQQCVLGVRNGIRISAHRTFAPSDIFLRLRRVPLDMVRDYKVIRL